jgi:squalene-associated FAD-dependent desaturase
LTTASRAAVSGRPAGPSEAAGEVVVIGGGLAGITAALDCAQAGANVTLVEVRRRLGGAAYSFEREGLDVDNGQHVFLRCCGAYRGLLERLGSASGVRIQERLEIPVLSPGREPAVLRRGRLPAPAHLAGALLRYPYLSVGKRLSAARAVAALARLDLSDPALEDGATFGQWLAAHGQDERDVALLWDLVVLPTLNLPAAQASLGLGAFVFKEGLLSKANAGDIGFHERPLDETLAEPAARALSKAGVRVLLGWRAQRIERDGAGLVVRGLGERGEEALNADVVIVAVPHARAAGLLEDLQPQLAGRLRRLDSSPIVNLHVVYDRTVCERRFAAGVRSPVQYLFDRTVAGGVAAGCQYLAVSLSGAFREMQSSVDELRERYLPALEALLPRARGARVEAFFATREHAATFRAAPGVARLRPGARTSTPGLLLAGAWTDTGWPATLEGAVISGHAAARAALGAA